MLKLLKTLAALGCAAAGVLVQVKIWESIPAWGANQCTMVSFLMLGGFLALLTAIITPWQKVLA